jgi:hypothetical protein
MNAAVQQQQNQLRYLAGRNAEDASHLSAQCEQTHDMVVQVLGSPSPARAAARLNNGGHRPNAEPPSSEEANALSSLMSFRGKRKFSDGDSDDDSTLASVSNKQQKRRSTTGSDTVVHASANLRTIQEESRPGIPSEIELHPQGRSFPAQDEDLTVTLRETAPQFPPGAHLRTDPLSIAIEGRGALTPRPGTYLRTDSPSVAGSAIAVPGALTPRPGTYLRTDSPSVAGSAIEQRTHELAESFNGDYAAAAQVAITEHQREIQLAQLTQGAHQNAAALITLNQTQDQIKQRDDHHEDQLNQREGHHQINQREDHHGAEMERQDLEMERNRADVKFFLKTSCDGTTFLCIIVLVCAAHHHVAQFTNNPCPYLEQASFFAQWTSFQSFSCTLGCVSVCSLILLYVAGVC